MLSFVPTNGTTIWGILELNYLPCFTFDLRTLQYDFPILEPPEASFSFPVSVYMDKQAFSLEIFLIRRSIVATFIIGFSREPFDLRIEKVCAFS